MYALWPGCDGMLQQVGCNSQLPDEDVMNKILLQHFHSRFAIKQDIKNSRSSKYTDISTLMKFYFKNEFSLVVYFISNICVIYYPIV
jgi:hypothetical protein